ncbi:MAG: hypothetical protein QOJ19_2052 [Acidimicrobiia bacterium]|nr:hypothetical protein [Acidimicrobiia bacterium]
MGRFIVKRFLLAGRGVAGRGLDQRNRHGDGGLAHRRWRAQPQPAGRSHRRIGGPEAAALVADLGARGAPAADGRVADPRTRGRGAVTRRPGQLLHQPYRCRSGERSHLFDQLSTASGTECTKLGNIVLTQPPDACHLDRRLTLLSTAPRVLSPGGLSVRATFNRSPVMGHRPANGEGMAGHVMGTQSASPFACLYSSISEWRAWLNSHIDEVITHWGMRRLATDRCLNRTQVSPRCTRQETGGSHVWAGRCSWRNEPARRDIRRRRFSPQ